MSVSRWCVTSVSGMSVASGAGAYTACAAKVPSVSGTRTKRMSPGIKPWVKYSTRPDLTCQSGIIAVSSGTVVGASGRSSSAVIPSTLMIVAPAGAASV